MTCRYCGTALPDGALFCGECGQPVSAAHSSDAAASSSVIVPAARSARGSVAPSGVAVVDPGESAPATIGFSIADLAFSSPGETSEPEDDDRELPDGTPLDGAGPAGSEARCPQCGEPMAAGDVFCGECGFVVRTVSPPSGDGTASEAEPHDVDATTEVEPLSIPVDDVVADADTDVDADDPDGIDDLVLSSGPAYAVPGPEADPADADRVWDAVGELRTSLDIGLNRRQRLLALVSLRSLGGYSVRGLFRRTGPEGGAA